MNYLSSLPQLKNKYFIMRHGESTANDQELIISDPKDGLKNFGLTLNGRRQIQDSLEHFESLEFENLDRETIILSSDFLRTRETAEIVHETLKTRPVIEAIELRERYFGIFEGTHRDNYHKVWEVDQKNPESTLYEIESVTQVLDRTTSLVYTLEQQYEEEKFLLVSHGDTLHILVAGFMGVNPSLHNKLLNLKNGEIRHITILHNFRV